MDGYKARRDSWKIDYRIMDPEDNVFHKGCKYASDQLLAFHEWNRLGGSQLLVRGYEDTVRTSPNQHLFEATEGGWSISFFLVDPDAGIVTFQIALTKDKRSAVAIFNRLQTVDARIDEHGRRLPIPECPKCSGCKASLPHRLVALIRPHVCKRPPTI